MAKLYIRGDERHRQNVIDQLMKLALDKVWEITIDREKKRRSISANNLYWQWLGVIANETGNDAETIHEVCKAKFLAPTQVAIGGEVAFVRLSTTRLSTLDFSDYMTKVEAWAASELGIFLPHPEDIQNYGRAA